MGANIKLTTIGDVVHHKGNLRVECRCGRRSVIDAAKLDRYYTVQRWSTVLEVVGMHLRCSSCGARGAHLRITLEPPRGPRWGPQTEEAWRFLIARLRNR